MMMRKLAEFAKTGAFVMTEMHKMMQGESAAPAKAKKEVLIKFKPGAKSAQIKAMASEFGLQQIKEIPDLNVQVYRITSTKTIKEIIENCGKHAFVEYEKNRAGQIAEAIMQVAHTGGSGDGLVIILPSKGFFASGRKPKPCPRRFRVANFVVAKGEKFS